MPSESIRFSDVFREPRGMKRVNTSAITIFKKTKNSPATLFKKKLRYRCVPVNFGKFLKNTFLPEHYKITALANTILYASAQLSTSFDRACGVNESKIKENKNINQKKKNNNSIDSNHLISN